MKKIFTLCLLSALCITPSEILNAQSGIISSARYTSNWANAGLPGDIPPDIKNGWTQSGSTITPSGDSTGTTDVSNVNTAINACGTNHYVLLSSGTFFGKTSPKLKSNCVLRGAGASSTIWKTVSGGSYNDCFSAAPATACLAGSPGTWTNGNCGNWPCTYGSSPLASGVVANITGGLTQGSNTITISCITANCTNSLVLNATPIVIDQCDVGFSGTPGFYTCSAPASGNAGEITATTIAAGGTGYAVNDTGTCSVAQDAGFGTTYGANCTYTVTAVSSGVVTAITVNSSYGYIYTQSGKPLTTTATSGVGSGLTFNVVGLGGIGITSGVAGNGGYDTGGILNCVMGGICANQNPANATIVARTQEEIFLVTAISGTGPFTLTLNRSIVHTNWAASQAPLAYWPNSTTGFITNAGIEDITFDQTPAGSGFSCVGMNSASYVWLMGLACNDANAYHVGAWFSSNVLIRDSYFFNTQSHGTVSYGIGCNTQCGGLLVENNILVAIVDPVNFSGGGGSDVVAYNYIVNQADNSTAFMFGALPQHAASTDYILYEGNVASSVNLDCIHGPHFFNTYFRNMFSGYSANEGTLPTNLTQAVSGCAFSRFLNLIGNVSGLRANGTLQYHQFYRCDALSPTAQSATQCGAAPNNGALTGLWELGWSHNDRLDFNNNPAMANDPITASSAFLWGNFDSINNFIHFGCITTSSSTCPSGSITSISESGNIATATSTANPGAGNTVVITGNSVSGYNVTAVVASSSGTSFTFSLFATGLGTGTGGTVTQTEVPTGEPNFPNSIPASHVLPPSFYNGVASSFASCGTGLSFWKNPTTGTCPAYPPIGPDVSSGDMQMCGSSGTFPFELVSSTLGYSPCSVISTSFDSGLANSIPAMRCYLNSTANGGMQGTPDGTGSFNTNFNRASCYASDPSTASNPPAPNPAIFAKSSSGLNHGGN